MSNGVHLRKYGVATNINFDLFEVDGVDLRVDAVSASGDGKIMKDNGAEANTATTTFVDEGQGYSQALSATEMQAARIVLYFVDQTATKVWLDKSVIIETYGNASAQHAFDLDTASTPQTGDSFTRLGVAGAGLTDITVNAASIDLMWDEVLTGGTHNVINSAGRRIRELEDATLIRGEAFQAGSTTTVLILDASASAIDNFYNFTIIRIVDGVAADQERIITDYNGTTKAATITPALTTSAPAINDEFKIVSGGSVHAETQGGGYEGGAVWIDTIDGVAGTLLYVNGTVDNPVDSIADARILADVLGMHVFHSLPGSTFTLAQTFNDFEFIGAGFTVALGGQNIGGSRFFNCAFSGIGTGSSRIVFRQCLLAGATTLPVASLIDCNFTANLTLSSAGIYRITNGIHGSSTSPIIDFGVAVLNTTVHIHGYHGAINIANMGQSGTDVLHFDSSGGKLTLDASCIGGTVNMNGTFDFINNGSGLTINNDGAIIEVIGTPVGDDISADIAALNNLSAFDILTQVNAALDTAIAELGVAAPAATPTLRTGLMLMYMALRNKLDVQTSGTDALEIHNNAGTQITSKLITDAGGDYSEAKMS